MAEPPRPQERVQRHTVEHFVDFVCFAPTVQILDAPVPQTVEQLPDILRFFDTLMPEKCPRSRPRTSPCALLVEQLVEVPTLVSPSL